MVIVIVSQGTTTSDSSSIGLTLSVLHLFAIVLGGAIDRYHNGWRRVDLNGGGSGDAAAGKTVFTRFGGLCRLSHVQGRRLDRHHRPRSRQYLRRRHRRGRDAASGLRARVDRRSRQVHRQGLHRRHHADDVRLRLSSTDIDNLVAFISENQTS